MTSESDQVRIPEAGRNVSWPLGTQSVTYIGPACVIQGDADFDMDALDVVRSQFPDRHVTLDGDVITVWPSSGTHSTDREDGRERE